MKRKVIIMLLTISSMILAINLGGCTNDKEELNQSMIITEDVQLDTEPKLKVLSNETIYFTEPLYWYSYEITFNDDNLVLNYTDVSGDRSLNTMSNIIINDNKAELEHLGNESIYEEPENLGFNVKKIADNSYIINNINSYDKYEVSGEIIDNESTFNFLRGNIFIEYENIYGFSGRNKLNWTNLESGECGVVDVPYQNIDISNVDILNGKLFLATRTKQETINNDTLVIFDLKENRIENIIELGEVTRTLPIDNERVLFISRYGTNSCLEIYNISNNTRKELIKYESTYKEKGDPRREIWELNQFNNREKIYYWEINIDKLYVKVAAINGMELEESIIVYEMDFDSKGSSPIPNVTISKDEMEMIIYNYNIETDSIEKFSMVKLNK